MVHFENTTSLCEKTYTGFLVFFSCVIKDTLNFFGGGGGGGVILIENALKRRILSGILCVRENPAGQRTLFQNKIID